ncbi:MAG: N-acetyl-gamma-glutamyl-phosphate reductase [Reichenbachiella sp.]|uniref:N-acetyl-gamma-glutamyl-phosphate reductase n=1 Tax=Reichenbachiella sp. TaxID=2184521 RepID=UPI003266FC86
MIKAGIIGGAGYTAGELLRILAHHPMVKISFVHSSSQSGEKIHTIHKDLIGELEESFTDQVALSVDVIFICSGHGKTQEFLDSYALPEGIKVIDLSNDFRLKAAGNDFVYGLPELNLNSIKEAKYLANPGCFATAIQLGLLPLAANGWLVEDVHVNALTGSTGAGQQPGRTSHYSWRNNNISIYKAFNHQHLAEINQSVLQLQNDFSHDIKFLPVRGNFAKGIFASMYTTCEITEEVIIDSYRKFYESAAFVHVLDEAPDMKQVINTNKCLIHVEKHGDTVLVTSVIDNLIKGASGQAVQNMNIMFGSDQKEGLRLKSSGF